jgi:hypothetical protein
MVGYLGSANAAKVTSSKLTFDASTGTISATSKSFLIDHPVKAGMKLQYGSLESPYHGIRLTGSDSVINGRCVVRLPDYIDSLVSNENINIQITNIKHGKTLWVDSINLPENYFVVCTETNWFDNKSYEFYWSFTAIRKDVADLKVEF